VRILLTNDDGIDAPGLEALSSSLGDRHQLTVVAPDRDRSGSSHSISAGRAIDASAVGPGRWALSGTPADCVRIGAKSLFSGTIGAARQAALMGIPAIAVSAARYAASEDALAGARFVARNINRLLRPFAAGCFISVNLPPAAARVVVASPGRLRYDVQVSAIEPPDGTALRRFLSLARLLPPQEGDSEDFRGPRAMEPSSFRA